MTEYQVEFLPAAIQDVKKAHKWYSERSSLAALHFKQSLDAATRSLADRFLSLAPIDEKYRWVRVRGFPYTLIAYLTEDHKVFVVAVAHTSRDSGFWKSR